MHSEDVHIFQHKIHHQSCRIDLNTKERILFMCRLSKHLSNHGDDPNQANKNHFHVQVRYIASNHDKTPMCIMYNYYHSTCRYCHPNTSCLHRQNNHGLWGQNNLCIAKHKVCKLDSQCQSNNPHTVEHFYLLHGKLEHMCDWFLRDLYNYLGIADLLTNDNECSCLY